jgi:hypothetical protein
VCARCGLGFEKHVWMRQRQFAETPVCSPKSGLSFTTEKDLVLEELAKAAIELEPDALRALLYLAERLLVGQKAYGKLDLATDPRDWKRELEEEVGDLLVYSAFEALKKSKARRTDGTD